MRLPAEMQSEIIPKNILMVGPTGCGKTEIARRLAKLCRAPFVKVEATKFTEVGFHGRDVDTIVKDLLDASLTLVKEMKTEQLRDAVKAAVEARILEALTGPGAAEDTVESFRSLLRAGALDDREVVVDVPVKEKAAAPEFDVGMPGMNAQGGIDIAEFMARIMPGSRGKTQTQRKTLRVRDARQALEEGELDKKLSHADLRREAVQYVLLAARRHPERCARAPPFRMRGACSRLRSMRALHLPLLAHFPGAGWRSRTALL
ncbi:AAA family ATPase [archaeon]|nr:MAG: AAA family ATPase [archaeon]